MESLLCYGYNDKGDSTTDDNKVSKTIFRTGTVINAI